MSDGETGKERLRAERRARHLAKIVDYGLGDAVARAGGQLMGFSVKYGGSDVLVTLRVRMPAGRMICFVGGETLGSALIKVVREANSDSLRLKADKYAR